jgi:hypothetical protein
MKLHLIFQNDDSGQIAEVTPAPNARLTDEHGAAESDEQFLRRIAKIVVPPGVSWRIVGAHQLPASRRIFRDAWRESGSGDIVVDMHVARRFVLNGVRNARNEKLEETDGEKSRLDEIGTPAQRERHAEYRQALRDFPKVIESQISVIRSPQELADHPIVWPNGATTSVYDLKACGEVLVYAKKMESAKRKIS